METELVKLLPNLSIGVISILALLYVTVSFLKHLKIMTEQDREERQKNQTAFRELEAEVRNKIMTQLNENTRTFEKVLIHFNTHN